MDTTTLLSKCFLFKKLEPHQIERLTRIGTLDEFPAGEAIVRAGSPGDSMYLLRYGTVVVEKDGQEIARLSSGSHFGEVALLDGNPRSATIRAVEHTEVFEIGREAFEAAMTADPALASQVYKAFCYYLCARLRRTNTQMAFFRDLAEG